MKIEIFLIFLINNLFALQIEMIPRGIEPRPAPRQRAVLPLDNEIVFIDNKFVL
jgi:hypothetical protein